MLFIICGEKGRLKAIQTNSHWLNKQSLAQNLRKEPKIMAMNLLSSQARNSAEKNKTISLLPPCQYILSWQISLKKGTNLCGTRIEKDATIATPVPKEYSPDANGR